MLSRIRASRQISLGGIRVLLTVPILITFSWMSMHLVSNRRILNCSCSKCLMSSIRYSTTAAAESRHGLRARLWLAIRLESSHIDLSCTAFTLPIPGSCASSLTESLCKPIIPCPFVSLTRAEAASMQLCLFVPLLIIIARSSSSLRLSKP